MRPRTVALTGSRRRATLGDRTFRATCLAAIALGRLHPRLARGALLRLWFTPWIHPSARAPITDLASGLEAWSLRSSGTTLRGYTGGSGPTVVLVHGWSGRAADWRHLAGDLIASGWRVVAVDLPAHGMTRGRRTDLFELGRATARVLEHERPAAVVVHSMGFPATMLALEGGAPAPTALVALAPGRKILHAVDGFVQRARLDDALLDQLIAGIEARYGEDVWDVLEVDRVLPDLAVPGLVIHDTHDEEVSFTDARRIAALWPGSELVRTSGLGHRRIVRDPEVRQLVIEALNARVERHVGADPSRTGRGSGGGQAA